MTTTDVRVEGTSDARSAGVVAVLSASLFWSFGGVLGKSANAPGVVLSFWRLWIASAVLLVVGLATGRWPSWADMRASAFAGCCSA